MQLKLSQKGESVYCDIMTHDGETGTPEHSGTATLRSIATNGKCYWGLGVVCSVDRTVSDRT